MRFGVFYQFKTEEDKKRTSKVQLGHNFNRTKLINGLGLSLKQIKGLEWLMRERLICSLTGTIGLLNLIGKSYQKDVFFSQNYQDFMNYEEDARCRKLQASKFEL